MSSFCFTRVFYLLRVATFLVSTRSASVFSLISLSFFHMRSWINFLKWTFIRSTWIFFSSAFFNAFSSSTFYASRDIFSAASTSSFSFWILASRIYYLFLAPRSFSRLISAASSSFRLFWASIASALSLMMAYSFIQDSLSDFLKTMILTRLCENEPPPSHIRSYR